MSLRGKRVVVVGGTSGIGLATVRRAAGAGASVVAAARSEDRLDAVRRELGSHVEVRRLDITRAGVRRFGDEVGEMDHLVLPGSSGAVLGAVREMDLERAVGFVDSKLIGPARVAQVARLRPGGSITFFSGAGSRKLGPGGAMVSAVNAAVEALASTMALELAPIRVNTVAPGFTDTPVWDTLMDPSTKEVVLREAAARLPLGRLAAPDEIAGAVLFLMENDYVTGEVLVVDGGHART